MKSAKFIFFINPSTAVATISYSSAFVSDSLLTSIEHVGISKRHKRYMVFPAHL